MYTYIFYTHYYDIHIIYTKLHKFIYRHKVQAHVHAMGGGGGGYDTPVKHTT